MMGYRAQKPRGPKAMQARVAGSSTAAPRRVETRKEGKAAPRARQKPPARRLGPRKRVPRQKIRTAQAPSSPPLSGVRPKRAQTWGARRAMRAAAAIPTDMPIMAPYRWRDRQPAKFRSPW